MVRSAIQGMSAEQLEQYKKIREEMCGTIDFEDNHILQNMPPLMKEAGRNIVTDLRSLDSRHAGTISFHLLDDNLQAIIFGLKGSDLLLVKLSRACVQDWQKPHS